MIGFLLNAAVIGLLGFSPLALAHSIVNGINIDGKYWQGYQPSFGFNPPKLIGWSIPEDKDLGFVDPSDYSSAAIACHIGATPAPISAPCQAGSTVTLEWNPWIPTHKGPVITYLANCNGPCETVDVMALEFFKIDELGLLGQPDGQHPQGRWASDQLLENNSSWTLQLPKDIAAGNYILRHEIIALHSAHLPDGTQHYPQCINLKVESSGTASPKGIPATELYTPDSTKYDIWVNPFPAYTIPGPSLYNGGTEGGSVKKLGMPDISRDAASETAAPSGLSAAVATASTSSATSASATANVAASQNPTVDDEDWEDDDDDTCEL